MRSGSYRENVRIEKPLSLIGEGPENTDISARIPGFLSSYGAIDVWAEDVTISGFTLKDTDTGIYIEDDDPPHSRCKIIGNNIINNYGNGILIEAGENHVVSGNNITGSKMRGIILRASNSIISGNNITGNGFAGIYFSSCSNITISGNNISSNGVGVELHWDGPFYVYGNNITDNQGYGIQFDGCSNSSVYQNNIERNSIGVELLNHPVTEGETASGNIVYRNNIVDNLQQAFIDPEYDLAEMFPERSNGTDVVSWDNGKEGNYWSDYQTRYPDAAEVGTSGIGDTPYVIDENNTDHHPLMQAADISSIPPPISEPSSGSQPIIVAIVVAVVVVILAIVFLVYRMRAPPPPKP